MQLRSVHMTCIWIN